MAPEFVSAPGDWFSYGFGSIFVISGGLACLKNSKSNHPTEKGFKPLSGSPNGSCVFPLAVLLVLGGLSAQGQSAGMQWDPKSGEWVVSYRHLTPGSLPSRQYALLLCFFPPSPFLSCDSQPQVGSICVMLFT